MNAPFADTPTRLTYGGGLKIKKAFCQGFLPKAIVGRRPLDRSGKMRGSKLVGAGIVKLSDCQRKMIALINKSNCQMVLSDRL